MRTFVATILLLTLAARGRPAEKAEAAGAEAPRAPLVRQLDNGMTVIVAERRATPVCTLQVWVRCGSLTEEERLGSGISHFVEHMLFKGTTRRGVRDMDREIRTAGGVHNAYTSTDRTVYHVTIPSRGFDVALDCLADAVTSPLFDPEETEREREVILKEIGMADDSPGRLFHREASRTLFLQGPERHPVIGYREVFLRLTRDDLAAYWRRHYVPENIFVLAVGDLDADATVGKIRAAFAKFERHGYLAPRIPGEPEQAAPRSHTFRDRLFRNARVLVAWPTVSIASPDLYPLDTAAAVLGDGPTSRLHRRLVEKDRSAFSADAWNHTPGTRGHFGISVTCEEENVPRVLAAIDEEVASLRTGRISEPERERVLARLRAESVFRRQTVDGLARELGSDFLLTGDAGFSAHYRAGMEAVRPQEVAGAVLRHLLPARRSVVVGLPELPEPPPPPAAGAPSAADSRRVERFDLPGGGRLLVYERHDDPAVAVSAVFLGGVRFETAAQNGVSDLMARLLTRGTRRFSAERLDELVAARGGSLEGYGGRNSFGVSARFLSADLPLALDLVGEVLAAPGFPEEEFAKARRLALAGLQHSRESISKDNARLLDRLLYEPHPYARQAEGTGESLGRLTRADVAAFHAAFCRPDNMVLCVAGDVSAGRVHALVLRSMKGFLSPRAAAFAAPEVPAVPVLRGARTEREPRPGARQAIVSLAFRGVSLRDPDRFALDGLRAVLSGMGSRLFTELRDRQSLAYSVGCYLDQGLDPGAFVFHIATRPDQIDRTLEAFWAEIEKVKTLPVTEEELERAKNSIVGREVVSRQGLGTFAQGLAYRELYGLGAESFFEDHRAIEKLTAADLLAAARRYLDSSNYVVAITAPEAEPVAPPAAGRRQEPGP